MSNSTCDTRIGPFPGWLGGTAALHGRYYAEHWDFPLSFECMVARDMAELLLRYDPARDLVLTRLGRDAAFTTLTLDTSDPLLPSGHGHLRWFVAHPAMQGHGHGRALLDHAMNFARDSGLTWIYLTTFRGLDAAARLYQGVGFQVVDERSGRTWGRDVIEQRWELCL